MHGKRCLHEHENRRCRNCRDDSSGWVTDGMVSRALVTRTAREGQSIRTPSPFSPSPDDKHAGQFSVTRRVATNITSHLGARAHRRLDSEAPPRTPSLRILPSLPLNLRLPNRRPRHLFPFRTSLRSSAPTLPKKRLQSSGLPGFPPRCIPPSTALRPAPP